MHADRQAVRILPVNLGGKVLGSVAIAGSALSDGAMHAIANLLATTLESVRNQELARRAEMARQSEEFKSTLLDALAHQLKTPLTGIKAAVTGLLSEPGSTAQENRELLAVINEESERLRRLVDESIHMARIEAGKLRLDLQPCAVRLLIERALDRLRPELGPRVVQVEEVHDPPAVRADLELVGMVLGHLLDNAAKYSPEGSAITIRAERQGEQVRFSVEDAGPGIPEEEQDRIFERYYRSRHTRDAAPGLGMGLAIARDIVMAHGGKMWFESVPGQGSRFYFTLPAARGDHQP